MMKGKSLWHAPPPLGLRRCHDQLRRQQAGTAKRPPAAPRPHPAGKPVDAATAGSVTGTIKLDGTAPKMKIINMAAEPPARSSTRRPP